MEFGGAQGDLFILPLQAGTSGERAGPLQKGREGGGGEGGGKGEREKRNKETEMERGGGERT